MRVCVPRESAPGEHRVALTPETVAKLGNGGFELVVERGAGVLAGFPDELYANAGARLADFPGALDGVEGIVRVGPPAGDEVAAYAPGTVLVGLRVHDGRNEQCGRGDQCAEEHGRRRQGRRGEDREDKEDKEDKEKDREDRAPFVHSVFPVFPVFPVFLIDPQRPHRLGPAGPEGREPSCAEGDGSEEQRREGEDHRVMPLQPEEERARRAPQSVCTHGAECRPD